MQVCTKWTSVGSASFLFHSETRGGSTPERGMKTYQYLKIGGEVTLTAFVDGLRTPVTIVLEIKDHSGLCNEQAAIDRDNAVDIG